MIPVREGLWTTPSSPDEAPQLIASRCNSCKEILFPTRQICQNCQSKNLQDIKLSRTGKIYSVTVVMQKPPADYHGPVPYAFGYVELSDGVRIQTLFAACDPDALAVGMPVELVIEKLHEDQQHNEISAYKFRPVSCGNSRISRHAEVLA